jgi:hypothetical protein
MREPMPQRLAGTLFVLAASASLAATPDPTLRNFVACPIVRDTATVPCWLAEYDGELYFLTLQTDVSAPVTPPWLGHRVLVEGTRSDKPRICGGIVLESVHLSVVPELDGNCNQMLPAEARYNLPFEPPRPPGPSKGRLAFDAPAAPRPAAASSRAPRTFTIHYDFNGLVGFRHPAELIPVLDQAQAVKATRIEIEGHRGAALLSDGRVLQEDPAIAQRRAEQVAELLRGAGLTQPAYDVKWVEQAPVPTGREDFVQRRVVVTVRP